MSTPVNVDVSAPSPVILPETVTSPAPSTVRFLPLAVVTAVVAERVIEPASTWNSELAPRVIAPDSVWTSVPAVDKLRITPVEDEPVPETVNGSAIDRSPDVPSRWRAAPDATVVPSLAPEPPSALLVLTTTMPFEIVVVPV